MFQNTVIEKSALALNDTESFQEIYAYAKDNPESTQAEKIRYTIALYLICFMAAAISVGILFLFAGLSG